MKNFIKNILDCKFTQDEFKKNLIYIYSRDNKFFLNFCCNGSCRDEMQNCPFYLELECFRDKELSFYDLKEIYFTVKNLNEFYFLDSFSSFNFLRENKMENSKNIIYFSKMNYDITNRFSRNYFTEGLLSYCSFIASNSNDSDISNWFSNKMKTICENRFKEITR